MEEHPEVFVATQLLDETHGLPKPKDFHESNDPHQASGAQGPQEARGAGVFVVAGRFGQHVDDHRHFRRQHENIKPKPTLEIYPSYICKFRMEYVIDVDRRQE